MDENSSRLAPTLWRTFRVIANAKRLRCLKFVLKQPDSTVEQVARAVRIPEAKASQALRAIQSRGLVASHRQSRWLRHSPDPDPSVSAADAFLLAMKSALLDERIPEAKIVEAATAYTHPRRIEIVRALAFAGTAEPHALSVQLGISLPALRRHLGNLRRRGVVENANRRYSLSKAKNKLAHDLLLIVLM